MISHKECYRIVKIKRVIRDLEELNVRVPDQLYLLLPSYPRESLLPHNLQKENET